MKFLIELKELRNKIPVGIQHAIKLLEKNNGDVELSMEQAKIDFINELVNKAEIEPEAANKVLLKTNYNLIEAIKIISESKFSKTENIIKRNTSNERKSTHIYRVIINTNFHNKNSPEKEKLSKHHNDFLTLKNWLNYVDYEGFSSALYHDELEDVIRIFKFELKMKELSKKLEKAIEIHTQILEEFDSNNKKENTYPYYFDRIDENEIIRETTTYFYAKKEVEIYDRFINYVKQNINHFP